MKSSNSSEKCQNNYTYPKTRRSNILPIESPSEPKSHTSPPSRVYPSNDDRDRRGRGSYRLRRRARICSGNQCTEARTRPVKAYRAVPSSFYTRCTLCIWAARVTGRRAALSDILVRLIGRDIACADESTGRLELTFSFKLINLRSCRYSIIKRELGDLRSRRRLNKRLDFFLYIHMHTFAILSQP